MTEHERKPEASPEPAAGLIEPPEQYHGDLRKAAFLKRRAAYQLQAGGPAPAQAGAVNAAGDQAPGTRRR